MKAVLARILSAYFILKYGPNYTLHGLTPGELSLVEKHELEDKLL